MSTKLRALGSFAAASIVAACQLIAGIDSRSEYVGDTNDAATVDAPASAVDAANEAASDVTSTVDAGEPCANEGLKECLHARQPRTCTKGVWKLEVPCSGSTPSCRAGTCVSSCGTLTATCGNGSESCCASDPVSKHAINRDYDASVEVDGGLFVTAATALANVSDFRLDRFEVTVGRFRAFVDDYPNDIPALGAGKNENDADDLGWLGAWNALLPKSRDDFAKGLECNAAFQTWSGSTANDYKPINCITWYEAQAFCVWDGGRLPTEAEWMAAATADDARMYPWGATIPSPDAGFAAYGCTAPCTFDSIKTVGSFPLGTGRYGQKDLAGNLHEWVFDQFVGTYRLPCNDCAEHGDGGLDRVVRGGDYGTPDPPASPLLGGIRTAYRVGWAANQRSSRHGFRCARSGK